MISGRARRRGKAPCLTKSLGKASRESKPRGCGSCGRPPLAHLEPASERMKTDPLVARLRSAAPQARARARATKPRTRRRGTTTAAAARGDVFKAKTQCLGSLGRCVAGCFGCRRAPARSRGRVWRHARSAPQSPRPTSRRCSLNTGALWDASSIALGKSSLPRLAGAERALTRRALTPSPSLPRPQRGVRLRLALPGLSGSSVQASSIGTRDPRALGASARGAAERARGTASSLRDA